LKNVLTRAPNSDDEGGTWKEGRAADRQGDSVK